jgi:hypothetical protein
MAAKKRAAEAALEVEEMPECGQLTLGQLLALCKSSICD